MENANELLFRCSSLGHIMSEPKTVNHSVKFNELAEKNAEKILKYNAIVDKTTATAKKARLSIQQTAVKLQELGKLVKDSEGTHLSESTITHLVDVFSTQKHKRRETLKNKYLTKGNKREQDATTLYALVKNRNYKQNTERKRNGFIQGEWDLSEALKTGEINHTIDTKSSWSYHTFKRAEFKKLNSLYKWQGVGYMWLTGAVKHTVVYILVNGLPEEITEEKRKISWGYGPEYETDLDYISECQQIEINHIYDRNAFELENPHFDWATPKEGWTYDIPMAERWHEFTFDRDETEIKRLENRVIECRKWMNKHLFKI